MYCVNQEHTVSYSNHIEIDIMRYNMYTKRTYISNLCNYDVIIMIAMIRYISTALCKEIHMIVYTSLFDQLLVLKLASNKIS